MADKDMQPVREAWMFTQDDFNRFGDLSGDRNPIHTDPEFASQTAFGSTVAHGMLLFSAVRALIARTWPRAGLLAQDLMFQAPTYADEPLTLSLEPTGRDDAGNLIVVTRVQKPDGQLGLDGECVLHMEGGHE